MDTTTLAKTNLPTNREHLYDSGMTEVEYVNLSCHLNGKAQRHIKQLYSTLDERVNLHRNYKLDTDNEVKMANFEKIVVRIKELFAEGLESAVQVEHLF
jgi:hypothetical protein